MIGDRVEVDVGRERLDGPPPAVVEPDPAVEEAERPAVEDDADVDELAAFDARYDPQDRVLEGLTRHDRPRRARPRAWPGRPGAS
jgi:hypothetical protein